MDCKETRNNCCRDACCNGLPRLRYWCYHVLPAVYDDSLSYYECICKFAQILQCTIEEVEKLIEWVKQIDSEIDGKIENIVNQKFEDYINSQTFITEIENQIEKYVNSYVHEIPLNYLGILGNDINEHWAHTANWGGSSHEFVKSMRCIGVYDRRKYCGKLMFMFYKEGINKINAELFTVGIDPETWTYNNYYNFQPLGGNYQNVLPYYCYDFKYNENTDMGYLLCFNTQTNNTGIVKINMATRETYPFISITGVPDEGYELKHIVLKDETIYLLESDYRTNDNHVVELDSNYYCKNIFTYAIPSTDLINLEQSETTPALIVSAEVKNDILYLLTNGNNGLLKFNFNTLQYITAEKLPNSIEDGLFPLGDAMKMAIIGEDYLFVHYQLSPFHTYTHNFTITNSSIKKGVIGSFSNGMPFTHRNGLIYVVSNYSEFNENILQNGSYEHPFRSGEAACYYVSLSRETISTIILDSGVYLYSLGKNIGFEPRIKSDGNSCQIHCYHFENCNVNFSYANFLSGYWYMDFRFNHCNVNFNACNFLNAPKETYKKLGLLTESMENFNCASFEGGHVFIDEKCNVRELSLDLDPTTGYTFRFMLGCVVNSDLDLCDIFEYDDTEAYIYAGNVEFAVDSSGNVSIQQYIQNQWIIPYYTKNYNLPNQAADSVRVAVIDKNFQTSAITQLTYSGLFDAHQYNFSAMIPWRYALPDYPDDSLSMQLPGMNYLFLSVLSGTINQTEPNVFVYKIAYAFSHIEFDQDVINWIKGIHMQQNTIRLKVYVKY